MTNPVVVSSAVREAYEFSVMSGHPHELALEAAVNTALREAEPKLIERAANMVGEFISDIEIEQRLDDARPELAYHREALVWVAERFVEDLPVHTSEKVYAPADGDIVEVAITGSVTVNYLKCGNCDHAAHVWWTVESETGEYEFTMESDVRVRRIASNTPLPGE